VAEDTPDVGPWLYVGPNFSSASPQERRD